MPVKILGNGEVSVPMFVLADAFTSTAKTKIEAAGGTFQSLMPEKPGRDEPATAATSPDATDDASTAPTGDSTALDGGSADSAAQD